MSIDIQAPELPGFVDLCRLIRQVADEAGIHTTGRQRKRLAQTLLDQHVARNPAYAKERTTHADPTYNEVVRRLRHLLGTDHEGATP